MGCRRPNRPAGGGRTEVPPLRLAAPARGGPTACFAEPAGGPESCLSESGSACRQRWRTAAGHPGGRSRARGSGERRCLTHRARRPGTGIWVTGIPAPFAMARAPPENERFPRPLFIRSCVTHRTVPCVPCPCAANASRGQRGAGGAACGTLPKIARETLARAYFRRPASRGSGPPELQVPGGTRENNERHPRSSGAAGSGRDAERSEGDRKERDSATHISM